MESQISTEQQSNSLNDLAYTESPTDVMTIRSRSDMTHQERQKFWENAKYSTQPGSSNRDRSSQLGTEMEITTSWMEKGMLEGSRSLVIRCKRDHPGISIAAPYLFVIPLRNSIA